MSQQHTTTMSKEDEITLVGSDKHDQSNSLPLQAFYDAELLEVPPEARKLLHEYSKIPEDDIFSHIHQVRDRAWRTYPYPCIGHYRFLDLALPRSTAYPEILSRLKDGQQFLDMGCCLGQELRALAAAGVKSENLYGVDLHTEFFDIGYDLFRDRDTLNSLFLPASLFDTGEGSILGQLAHKVDIIWCGGFLHLFAWRRQVAAVVKMLGLLRRAPATMLAGRLMGSSAPGEYASVSGGAETGGSGSSKVYRHDAASFKKLFQEACDIVGEKWEMDVVAKPWEENLKIKTSERETTAPEGLLEVWFAARKLERIDEATSHYISRAWGLNDDEEFMY